MLRISRKLPLKKAAFFLFHAAMSIGTASLCLAQAPPPENPSKEYIRLGGRILAVENSSISVSILPASSVTLSAGQTQQFTATVTGSTNQLVNWSIQGVSPAGNPSGTISSGGLYTAPGTISAATTVTIRATSAADDTKFGEKSIQLQASPVTVSMTPSTEVTLGQGGQQQYTANVAVTWSIVSPQGPEGGSINASGLYTAPASIPAVVIVTIRAASTQDPANKADNTIRLEPPAPPITVTVSPSSASKRANQQQTFTATVQNHANQSVTWSLSPSGSQYGSINASGVYTAPASIPAALSTSVRATSVADGTKTGSATVNLLPAVSVTPASATLQGGQTQQFTATEAVNWSRSPAVGTISSSGLYTAPGSILDFQTVTITATSVADGTTSTATVTLKPTVVVSVSPQTQTVFSGQQVQFQATVTGASNTQVSWTYTPQVGTVVENSSTTALYTAPSFVASQQTVQLTAKSVVDPTSGATATITIPATEPPRLVSITPFNGTGATQTFAFSVSSEGGASNIASIEPFLSLAFPMNGLQGGCHMYFDRAANRIYLDSDAGNGAWVGSSVLGAGGATLENTQCRIDAAGASAQPQGLVLTLNVPVTFKTGSTYFLYEKTTNVGGLVADYEYFGNWSTAPPVNVSINPTSVALGPAGQVQFTATVTGTGNTAVNWTVDGPGMVSPQGLYTAPSTITVIQSAKVIATSVADPWRFAEANVTLTPPGNPPFSPIRVNAGGAQYTDPQGNVWSTDTGFVGGFNDGSSGVNGTNTPPLYEKRRMSMSAYQFSVPNGSYNVTMKFVEPYLFQTGARIFHVSINGQQVLTNFDIYALAGNSYALDRTFTVNVTNGQISIQFTQAGPSPALICAIQILSLGGVQVSMNPGSATVNMGQTVQFTATVTGSANTSVTWSRSPAVGTVSASGLYTAPSNVTSQQTVTVTATSVADPSKTAQATVTVNPVISVSVSPPTATLGPSQTQQFSATVLGTANLGVTWSINPMVGSIGTATGLYTAPATIGAQQTVTVTATSNEHPAKSGSATVTLSPSGP